MKKEDLFDMLGDLDHKYIIDAHANSKSHSKWVWARWGSLAACLALVFLVSIPLIRDLSPKDGDLVAETSPSEESPNSPIAELQAEKIEYANKEEASDLKQEPDLLVVNKVDNVVLSDMDVKITTTAKLPPDVWLQILEEFQESIGLSYDAFTSGLPVPWEAVNFYFASVPGYKDGWVEEDYRLHDYVFNCQTKAGGNATIALCSYEEPLRDCFVLCENPEISVINGVTLIIYEYANTYMTQFTYENVSFDIEADRISLRELENLLTGVIDTLSSASSQDFDDVPADSDGEYMEAITNDRLTKGTSSFFGGSYLDNKGNFTIVLTEDTPENRAAICKELGRSEANTTFVTGTYTLKYLTALQTKITDAMVNKELPFVVSSGVHETTNNIVVGVTTTDQAELAKVYALDTMGGAIEIKYSAGIGTENLQVSPKTE